MNLDKLLDAESSKRNSVSADVVVVDGDIAEDTDKSKFRVYPNPRNRKQYLVVPREAVAGELAEWGPQDLAHGGFAGDKVYRIPLKHGAPVQVISIVSERVGETIGANPFVKGERGECRTDHSCPYRCCTVSSSGSGICRCSACCVG